MRISDWSSDVCSSDLAMLGDHGAAAFGALELGVDAHHGDERGGKRHRQPAALRCGRLVVPPVEILRGCRSGSDAAPAVPEPPVSGPLVGRFGEPAIKRLLSAGRAAERGVGKRGGTY